MHKAGLFIPLVKLSVNPHLKDDDLDSLTEIFHNMSNDLVSLRDVVLANTAFLQAFAPKVLPASN